MTKPNDQTNPNSDLNLKDSKQGTPTEPIHLESNPVARKALMFITLAVALFLGYLLYTLK